MKQGEEAVAVLLDALNLLGLDYMVVGSFPQIAMAFLVPPRMRISFSKSTLRTGIGSTARCRRHSKSIRK